MTKAKSTQIALLILTITLTAFSAHADTSGGDDSLVTSSNQLTDQMQQSTAAAVQADYQAQQQSCATDSGSAECQAAQAQVSRDQVAVKTVSNYSQQINKSFDNFGTADAVAARQQVAVGPCAKALYAGMVACSLLYGGDGSLSQATQNSLSGKSTQEDTAPPPAIQPLAAGGAPPPP